MKAILKENGEVNLLLKEGNLEEVKKYLVSELDSLIDWELDSLIDWLDETENNWNDFETLKKEIKENIENAEDMEELEQAFKEINNEISWWGIYFSN